MPAPSISRQKFWQKIGYTPRAGQLAMAKAWDDGKRYISMFAYPRAGKSYGAANLVAPYLLLPDWHCWVVSPTYELGSKEFGYIFAAYVETGLIRLASSRHYDIRGGNMTLVFPWGSFVKVVSADNPTALRAEELDCLILAEASALGEKIYYNHLYARVAKRRGRVLVPTTPKGYNWVHSEFRVPSLPPGHKELLGAANPKYDDTFWSAVISATPEYGDILETGVYAEEDIERARRTMPLPLFKEQFGGDFASYAGNIYSYDPRTMLVDPFSIPHEWTHILGWDHGARDENPTAIMLGSYSPDGTLYWWGEIYRGNQTIRQYWQAVMRLMAGRAPTVISSDPSAKQVRIELMNIGVVSTFPHDRDIQARIVKMTQLIREGKLKILRGTCPNFVKEIQSWEWDEKQPGKPRPNQACHALDAAGYAVLIPVAVSDAVTLDPLTPVGEDLRTQQLWKPLRRKFKQIEDEQQRQRDDQDFLPSPFDEELSAEDYDFGAHQGVV